MAEEELLNSFEDRELETVSIMLVAKASKTAITLQEFIDVALAQGTPTEVLKQALIDDLKNNGRIFSEFRSAVKSTARGSINRIRDAGQFGELGVERKYRWSAVLVNTCPDCMANHGLAMTWEQWEESRFGLPRSGKTVCRENCHCVLVPAESTEIEPIVRKK